MPVEHTLLRDSPQPRETCPYCGDYPFEAVDRGLCQREKHDARGKRQDYCLVICSECASFIGYESPPWNSKAWNELNAADQQQRNSRFVTTLAFSVFLILIGALLLVGWLAISV